MIRMRFEMASASVAQAVLPRVVAAMGAQADLSVERIRDCIAVVGTILAPTDGDVLSAQTAALPGGIEVHVAPATTPVSGPGDPLTVVTVVQRRDRVGDDDPGTRGSTVGPPPPGMAPGP